MFLLDTNVLSELRRAERTNSNVAGWIDAVPEADMFLSAITIMEIELGTLMLLRRDPVRGGELRHWIDQNVLPEFEGRILPVDIEVAQCCARLHVPARRPERDALIGATAIIHRLAVVTRNVADFRPMGVEVINPWNAVR
jgi:hypothetical protein